MEFKENQLLNLAFLMITVYPPAYWVYVMFVYVLLSSLIKQDGITEICTDWHTEYALRNACSVRIPLKPNIHPQAKYNVHPSHILRWTKFSSLKFAEIRGCDWLTDCFWKLSLIVLLYFLNHYYREFLELNYPVLFVSSFNPRKETMTSWEGDFFTTTSNTKRTERKEISVED